MNTTLANINLFDPGTDSNPNIDHWYGISRYGGDLTFTLRNRFGESYLKLHSNFGKHKFYDGWRSRDQTLGIMVYHNLSPLKGNTSTIGFDIKRYGGNAENVSNAIDFGEYYITEWAPYFHCQQLMFERFIASAGLRLEHHNLYGYEILPKVGLVTHVTSSTSIRISAAKGFRSPSIRELHFFPPQNSDLDPERIQNYEIGFNQYLGYRIKLETVIFRSEGNNLIRRSNPGFPFEWTNSGKFTHTGYEILFQWLPWDQLETGISWTKLDLGNETLYSPGKKLTAYLNYQFRGMTFSGNLLHVKDLYGMDDRQLHMDDYTLLNISLQMELFKTVRIKGTLNNALNAKYQAMFDYPMPGRYFTIEMGFVF
jgi:iron complex outermembrane receptor protein